MRLPLIPAPATWIVTGASRAAGAVGALARAPAAPPFAPTDGAAVGAAGLAWLCACPHAITVRLHTATTSKRKHIPSPAIPSRGHPCQISPAFTLTARARVCLPAVLPVQRLARLRPAACRRPGAPDRYAVRWRAARAARRAPRHIREGHAPCHPGAPGRSVLSLGPRLLVGPGLVPRHPAALANPSPSSDRVAGQRLVPCRPADTGDRQRKAGRATQSANVGEGLVPCRPVDAARPDYAPNRCSEPAKPHPAASPPAACTRGSLASGIVAATPPSVNSSNTRALSAATLPAPRCPGRRAPPGTRAATPRARRRRRTIAPPPTRYLIGAPLAAPSRIATRLGVLANPVLGRPSPSPPGRGP